MEWNGMEWKHAAHKNRITFYLLGIAFIKLFNLARLLDPQ
jgi:hypothetical protein